jgi:putative endonuclease
LFGEITTQGGSVHHEGKYRVYVLRNAAGRRYIGVTDDVDRRLVQHNQGVSRWTRGRGPWNLEWLCTPRSLGDARALENLMKRQKGGAGLETLMREHRSSGS